MKYLARFAALLLVCTALFFQKMSGQTAASCTASATLSVTIQAAPVAGFSPTINGLQANFQNNSSNSTSWTWDFGDGQTSTAQNPAHDYAAGGSYTVILTATGGNCGAASFTQVVNILGAPNAGFSANVLEGCVPLTVVFTNQTSNGGSVAWSFPGGNPATSTAQNPTVVYQNGGQFNVSLTATNASGADSEVKNGLIMANPQPAASFTSQVGGSFVAFTNASTDATSFIWDFGDGQTSGELNTSHNYGNDGTYTVVLTATNACGSTTYTQNLNILTAPTAGFSVANSTGCVPLTVSFQNESSANSASFFWEFPGGEPENSTDPNPTITWNSAGKFDVYLTATNAAGTNTKFESTLIVVNGLPQTAFDVSLNGLDAAFQNQSASATTFAWNFGDGSTSSEENPAHSYSTGGQFQVTLVATNDCGSMSYVQNVFPLIAPVAAFSASQTDGCAPLTVSFLNQTTEQPGAYLWTFSGGNPATSTAENPTVVFETPGSFAVSLVATNAAGESESVKTNFISVGGPPTANFTTSVAGLTASFANNSAGATSYLWTFGDGQTSTEAAPSHEYTTGGVFQVMLVATNACGSFTFEQNITTMAAPVAGFSATVLSGCAPLTVQFVNQSTQNSTAFLWNFGNGQTSTDPNPTVVFENAGQFSVSLLASNAAGENTASQPNFIEVFPQPVAAFSSQTTGSEVIFANNSLNSTQFSWNFGDGQTSAEASPTHQFSSDGPFIVSLTAENDHCGPVVFVQEIVIATLPVAGFSANILSGCAPLTVVFANESSANTTSFSWNFPGGTPAVSSEQNPIIVFENAGIFGASLTTTNAQGNDLEEKMALISVKTTATASFSSAINVGQVAFTNTTTGGATTFFWNFGDGQTSTDEHTSHTYGTSGTYTVVLSATNDCGTTLFTEEIVVVIVGTNSPTGGVEISLFPNPNAGVFTLKITGEAAETTRIRILDVLSRVIFEEKLPFGDGKINRQIELPTAAAGPYLLEWMDGDGRVFYRKMEVTGR